MAYEQLEEIQSRRGEKIALFLTLENAVGLILVAFPAYIISANMPFLLRVLIVLTAALLGVLATVEMHGLTAYARLLWAGRGIIRQRIQGNRITPAHLVGAPTLAHTDRPLPRGGPIRRRSDPPRRATP